MEQKVGRNDPCPCGSGKKYKQCCFGKESKPTYTATGQRKFKATVLKMPDKAQLFQGMILPSSKTLCAEELKFDATPEDNRAAIAPPDLPFEIPLPPETDTSSPATATPLRPPTPPDSFQPSDEDFTDQKGT